MNLLLHLFIKNSPTENKTMRTKGRFLNKQQWFSICSTHFEYNPLCKRCTTGIWKNIYMFKLSSIFYNKFPKLWIWWMNLKLKKFK
jgi:hypothetical protein